MVKWAPPGKLQFKALRWQNSNSHLNQPLFHERGPKFVGQGDDAGKVSGVLATYWSTSSARVILPGMDQASIQLQAKVTVHRVGEKLAQRLDPGM